MASRSPLLNLIPIFNAFLAFIFILIILLAGAYSHLVDFFYLRVSQPK